MNPFDTHPIKNIGNACYSRRAPTSKVEGAAATRLPATVARLSSRFALEQLSAVAKRTPAPQFVMLMAAIFGHDLAPRSYIRLQQALVEGTFAAPEHRISHTAAEPADYDNHERVIRLNPTTFAGLLETPARSWELLAILLHEFGHHVDNLLRQELSETPLPDRDAPGEEGSRYAWAMALQEATGEGSVCIARYTLADADEAQIVVDYRQAMAAVAAYQGDGHGSAVGEGPRERFEAGSSDGNEASHFSHESIAGQLQELGFSEDEVRGIYFGNWLRDYSQLLDPKIVRATDMPKDFPNLLSRQALTRIVDVLAARKFSDQRGRYTEHFNVTEAKLGVYRPSEHIDNPKVGNPKLADPRSRDADFEPWVRTGDPLLEVDYQSSMKRYIQRSRDSMVAELEGAMQAGRSSEGLRRLGAALHLLEDYFAHSNFVELSLIKCGYKVLPWTSKADCQHAFPLVTGTFGGSDIIASLAYPIAQLVAPAEGWKLKPAIAGERSDNEKMMLILLEEHQDEQLLKTYQNYLAWRDALVDAPWFEYVALALQIHQVIPWLLKHAYGTIFQGVFKLLGNSVDDVQSQLGDPNSNGSTDPSHSQLAKDHAEHPFHELAAQLARTASLDVATAVRDVWDQKPAADPTILAADYFVHPEDSTWQDRTVAEWAAAHPEAIRRGALKSELDKLREQLHEVASGALKKLEQDGMSAWEYLLNNIAELMPVAAPLDIKEAIDKSEGKAAG